ncbi:MAG: TlyA family RNA methyltransferase [Thermodesulfobacteriota bacterium]
MAKKLRADQLLFDLGLAESREKGKRLIMAGAVVRVLEGREEPVRKPGDQLPPDAVLRVAEPERYVSRGGRKLETALEHFSLDVTGFVCLDAGASTGGFTDCLLQHGAARVYAADVGKGQLDAKLRADARVVCLEEVNLRHAPADLIPEPVDLVTADLSFISLTKVLPALVQFLKPGGRLVALVKPQFELGPGAGDKGVVRDPALQQQAVAIVTNFCRDELGLSSLGAAPAKIKGPKGNQEYLAAFVRPA